jgi:uncharacterized protein
MVPPEKTVFRLNDRLFQNGRKMVQRHPGLLGMESWIMAVFDAAHQHHRGITDRDPFEKQDEQNTTNRQPEQDSEQPPEKQAFLFGGTGLFHRKQRYDNPDKLHGFSYLCAIMNPTLKAYIEQEILPRYTHFDKAHQLDHITTVIDQSAKLADMLAAQGTEVDRDMVYVIAAYHDLGIVNGRENHHTDSGKILMADPVLPQYFTSEQLVTMKEAVEDHRASSKQAPRSLYGRIVAEADRQIDPHTILLRTLQFGLKNYPELDKAGHFARAAQHLAEKYGEGGYLKLWFPESDNSRKLAELRRLIADKPALLAMLEEIWETEV